MIDQPITPPKRRNWFARHPKTSIFLAIILAIAIGLFAFDTIAKRRLAARIDAIRAKGEPVCVEDLKKLVRPGPNSLPNVLAIAPAALAVKLGDKSSVLPYIGGIPSPPTGCKLPDEQLAAARWYLDELKTQLPAMHDAMKKGRGTISIQWADTTFDSAMPELSKVRAVTKVHALEILVAAEQSDAAHAGRLLVEHRYFLDLLGDDSMLMNMLVQVALHVQYLDRVERTINRCSLAQSDLTSIQEAIAFVECLPNASKANIAERVMQIDSIASLLSITGNMRVSRGRIPGTFNSWTLVPGIMETNAVAGLDTSTELIATLGSSDRGLSARIQAWEAKVSGLPWYCAPTRIMIPANSRSLRLWIRSIGLKRAMLVALAAEQYRLDNNHWPASPSDLVPKYIASIPLDPIDDQPIRYAIIPEGIKVWTISGDGTDADDGDEDQGGDVGRLETRQGESWRDPRKGKDSGWVILNPDLRGRSETVPISSSEPTLPTTRPHASPNRN